MAGLCATPFTAPYNVSKFAALAASECLAHDLAAVGAPIGVSVVVPSAVATRIGKSGRNRPDALAGTTSDDAAFVEQALVDLTVGHGLPPEEVATMILDAIRTNTYLVPTKESYVPQLRASATPRSSIAGCRPCRTSTDRVQAPSTRAANAARAARISTLRFGPVERRHEHAGAVDAEPSAAARAPTAATRDRPTGRCVMSVSRPRMRSASVRPARFVVETPSPT